MELHGPHVPGLFSGAERFSTAWHQLSEPDSLLASKALHICRRQRGNQALVLGVELSIRRTVSLLGAKVLLCLALVDRLVALGFCARDKRECHGAGKQERQGSGPRIRTLGLHVSDGQGKGLWLPGHWPDEDSVGHEVRHQSTAGTSDCYPTLRLERAAASRGPAASAPPHSPWSARSVVSRSFGVLPCPCRRTRCERSLSQCSPTSTRGCWESVRQAHLPCCLFVLSRSASRREFGPRYSSAARKTLGHMGSRLTWDTNSMPPMCLAWRELQPQVKELRRKRKRWPRPEAFETVARIRPSLQWSA